MIHSYFAEVSELLKTVEKEAYVHMNEAAEKIAMSIQNDGIIHLFGCGHSNILVEEVYYRAGGLVAIHPIFHEELMLNKNAVRASELEREMDYAKQFMKDQDIRENDIMIVISTSGRNPVPIDVALIAKEKGAFVIGISSFSYSKSQSSRHRSGKFLHEVVDLQIDNHVPVGDVLLHDDKVPVGFAPASTVVGVTIMNSIFASAIAIMANNGFEPPILLSGNVDGADEHNKKLIEKYRDRISLVT